MNGIIRTIIILIIGATAGIGLFTALENSHLSLPTAKLPGNNQLNQSKTVVKENSDIVNVVKNVGPTVVSIAVQRRSRTPFGGLPFDPFTAPQPSQNNESGIGTGFIVAANGIIVTNKHVVDANEQYVVITSDNKKYDVKQITKDPFNDLALLKIDASNLKAAELGDSSQLDVGQTVIAMGNALGEFRNTVTTGVVSGLHREINASDSRGTVSESLGNVIQTDAAINPGNSGGPLLNIAGQVIGINTAVAAGGVAQNIGFAIPVDTAKPIINEFLASGKISRPYIGVQYQMVTKRLSILNEIPEGAYLEEVVSNSPAAQAGLQQGDIITEINNKKITETTQLSTVIRTLKVNDKIEIKYYRNEENRTAQVTVGESKE